MTEIRQSLIVSAGILLKPRIQLEYIKNYIRTILTRGVCRAQIGNLDSHRHGAALVFTTPILAGGAILVRSPWTLRLSAKCQVKPLG